MNDLGNWHREGNRVDARDTAVPAPIAIIGMACRLPGGVVDYDGMWQFLLERRTAIREIPADRWNLRAFHDTDPNAVGRGRSRWAGFLDNVFDFDPAFFDLSPREALAMDPQQRLLLQVAYEAAQDAGVTLDGLATMRTGVFVGISSMEFTSTQRVQTGSGDIFGGTGSALSIAANRISHRLNLRGPSFVVDTACSSALVALDQACRNLADGSCDVALAGGVNCLLDPTAFVAFAKANMLSPSGGCFSFDQRADGFIRGEGAGLVLLKPLDKAKRDGDRIHAIIRATGVNQDGRTSTLTSPNGVAQEALMREVLALAGIGPQDIGYVEAHGTGTPTGDPIEAGAIGRVFGRNRDGGPIPVSSIKPNIGHLESAAGVAGILKAVMTLKERTIAPHQNFEVVNPAIPLDALNITIPVAPLPFPKGDGPRRVVVNSFGFGGTSACAVVEEVEAPVARPEGAIIVRGRSPLPGPQLVPISAPNAEGLAGWAGKLARTVRAAHGEPAAVAHALAGRDHFASRAVVLSQGGTEGLVDALARIERNEPDTETGDSVILGKARPGRRLVCTFSGQGTQWWAMGRQLLNDIPAYRDAIAAFDRHFEPLAGWRVADALAASESESRINHSNVTQAALIAMQIALAAAWRERGVVPDFVLGHSLGEIAAAHVAGAISLQTTARIIYHRGLIAERSPETGAMAAVALSEEAARSFLDAGDDVVIGAINGPAMVTLTGIADPLDKVLARIREAQPGVFARKLNTGFAWHSRLLDHGEAWFRTELGKVEWSTPTIPLISTVEPGFQTRFDLDYWWQNLRQPVRYRDAILLALDLGLDSFLEIGPHRTVTPLTVSVANERSVSAVAVPSLERGGDDHKIMARTTAQLFVAGHAVDWTRLAPPAGSTFQPPLYPWRNQTLRQYSTEAAFFLNEPVVHPLLGKRDFGPVPRWISEIESKAFQYFRDHRILGGAVLPAAGYVEMMIAALRAEHGPGTVELRSLRFPEALALDGDIAVLLRTEYDPALGKLRVFSRERGPDEEWRLRAEGYGLSRPIALPDAPPPSRPAGEPTVDGPDFYELAARHGYEYGRLFQGVEAIWLTGELTSLAIVDEPDGLDAAALGYTLHPATFDSALQSAIALYDRNKGLWDPEKGKDDQPAVDPNAFVMRIPVEIDKILVYDTLPARSLVDVVADADGESGIYRLYGEDGRPAVIVERLRTKALKSTRSAAEAGTPSAYYVEHIRPVAQPEVAAGTGDRRWLLIAPGQDASASIAAVLQESGVPTESITLADLPSRLGQPAEGAAAVAGIVYAPLFGAAGDSPAAATDAALTDFVALCEAVAKLEPEKAPRIVLLTACARLVVGDPPATAAAIASRALLAGARTIANERPGLRITTLDVGAEADAASDALGAGILVQDQDTERILRGRTWYAPRLEPVPDELQHPRRLTIDTRTSDANYKVTLSQPGSLDNILLREEPMPVAGRGEIVIEIAAVGLNFRDIMAATSILPGEREGETAWWRNLGFEFSGVVRALGPGVRRHQIGDRVIGLGKGFMRRYAKVDGQVASKVPDELDLTAAATIPIAFLTAEYCLIELGRLKRGESVLIHLGTGGVGLAAIQVARAIGAKIFATAGSEEKRAYLRQLGIAHVMDSRSLDFAEQVRAATGGRGVDVVLNSLAGAGIEKGLECLAPLGRFVEIGKRDLAADHPIGLRSLYHNNSYAVFDLGEVLDVEPQALAKPFRSILRNIERGIYAPLPTTLFSASRAADAMRHLAKAVHIGKVVVAFDETEVSVEHDLSRSAGLRSDASYLVTGGLRGFGLTVAEWMAQKGAGRLVLASRKGTPDAADAERFAALGQRTEVRAVALDVTDSAAVSALVSDLAKGDKPLAGIVHSAAVIDDALIDQLDQARIAGVVDPKLGGAWNLHNAALAAGARLDHFVTFSSIAAAVGSIGQANYVAANAGLERLSEHRRALSLPGMAIGWGSLADSGFVARSEAIKKYLASGGIRPLSDAEALGALDRLVRVDEAAMVYAAVDWTALGRALKTGTTPRLAALAADRVRGGSRLAARLAAAPEEEHERIVAEAIRGEVARVLRIDPSAIALDRRLTELGLDSLSSFELKNHIEALCDLTIPVAKFLQAPTVAGLASVVTGLLAADRAKQAAIAAEAGKPVVSRDDTALPTIPRQALLLGLGHSPATNDALRAALVLRHVVAIDPLLSPDAIEAALATVVEQRDALRLHAVKKDGEEWAVEFGAGPVLSRLSPAEPVPGVPDADGSLWTVALREAEGRSELVVAAHRAAADQAAVRAIAEAVLSVARGAVLAPSESWADFARARTASEESDRYRRDYAYWSEMLGRAPTPLLAVNTTRARMPSRLGIPRGPLAARVGPLDLPGFDALPAEDREITAIAAFARAIGAEFGSDAVIIDRHDPFRRDTGGAGPAGPVADTLSLILTGAAGSGARFLERTRQTLAGARSHRAFDRATIDRVFERQLTDRPVALGEFGFSLIEGAQGAEAWLVSEPWNAVRLNILRSDSGSRGQLVFDTDAIGDERADRLVRAFATELAALAGADTGEWRTERVAPQPSAAAGPAHVGTRAAAPQVIVKKGGLLPVSMQQQALLATLADPRTTDVYRRFWLVSRAYWIRPQIDLSRLNGIVETIMQRHEMLRGRFVVEDGTFRLRIDERVANPLIVEDLGDVGEEVALARVRELAHTPLDPLSDPLYVVRMFRCGKQGDLLFCLGHHSILDGWSMSVLIEELMAGFFGLPLPPVEMSVGDYLTEFDRSHDPIELERREAYFRRLLADPPRRPTIGRAAKGLAPNLDMVDAGPGAELIARLGVAEKRALAEAVRRSGATESARLLAAFAETLAPYAGGDDVVMLVPTAMRTDRRLRNFIGWVATLMPVRAALRASPSTDQLARSMAEQMRDTTSYLPADFTLQGSLRDELSAAGSYVALFNAGMQTVDSLHRGSATAAFHRPGGGEEIDFGPVQIRKVGDNSVRSETIWELDLRSFDSEEGAAVRLGYDTLGFTEGEAKAVLSEVVDRLGAKPDLDLEESPAAAE